ncbi:putative rhamnosyl transferase [Paenibacillus sp. p3-SID867]|uniref:putative rhamnosyl transferase n=1 Tax=Paenibacillus sp. p3-SID867 TaxID=2916363 RepID=UPI0021A92D48|nr:putative rhamnosyl transferase [Paenibacillus sp. p3-SID867]MCT1403453.1 putative rhamnosyl transferase [Paenibacillus sp. p3-SID867]
MKKHIFIIVRYSLLTSKRDSWIIARQDFENYRKQLFDNGRLSQREQFFEKITLSSIINQSIKPNKDNCTLIILTSDELPKEHYNKLHDMVSIYPWVKIISLPPDGNFGNSISSIVKTELLSFNEEVCYCTVRLDDDDGLSFNYFEKIQQYMHSKFNKMCISFGLGVAGVYDPLSGVFTSVHEYYQPKIAIGLAYIDQFNPQDKIDSEIITIFHLGNHQKIDSRCPVVVDSRDIIFFRTVHILSDSGNDKTINKITTLSSIDKEMVIESFNIKLKINSSFYEDISKSNIRKKSEDQKNTLSSKQILLEQVRNKMLEDEIATLKNKYREITNSRSWKIMGPARYTASLLRKIYNTIIK